MAMNMVPGKSWWLLKNGKILYYGGILSIFLYILLLIILFPYLFTGKDVSFVLVIVLAAIILAIVAVIYISSDYFNLYRAIERLPESYEIWTPLRRSSRYLESSLHDYTDSEIKGMKPFHLFGL